MKGIKTTLIALIILIFLGSCSSSYTLTNTQKSPNLNSSDINDFLVLVLYPDDKIESRVVLEKSIVDELNLKGYNANCGYLSISNYNNLENRTDEIISALRKTNSKNLLIIDPVHFTEHDDSDYYNEVAIYRAMGMESSVFWSSVQELAESADASFFIMGVSLWNLNMQKFTWQGTYEIKAPGGYDLEYAKVYAKEFTGIVLNDITEVKI